MNREIIHILLVEDSETHAATMRKVLESGPSQVKLTVAQTLAEARTCLSESFPDLAIVDLLLPDGKGIELLPADQEEADYPTVIMTNCEDVQVAVETMKAGAMDYVVKSTATLADMPRIVEETLREWARIVERKQVEEALREGEEWFRSFFESSAVGMAIISPEGKAIKINPTFCRLSGYSETEALHKNVFEVTHPEDREETQRIYNEIRTGRRKVVDYEKRYLRKDGEVVWGRATVAGVFGPNKDLLYYAANVQDITERKQAVKLLQESRQMLQLVLDYIPQHVFWKDRNSVYLGCNQNFARVAGVEKPEDIVGKTDYDLPWKKEEADFFRQCDKRTMESDTPEFHIIEEQLQSDGKQAWLDTNKVPLHDAEENVVGILGTFEDITERKQAEYELQESEERFRAFFEQAAVGVAQVSPAGHLLRVNKKFCDIAGYSREELQDRTFQDITHPDDLEADMAYVRQMLAGEMQTYSIEKRYIRKDETPVWINLTVALRRNPEGSPKYFISIIEDISQRKAMEERLKAANRELEAFVYTVSHDLRTPLTPIIGYAEFLKESYKECLDQQGLDCLTAIMIAGDRMLALMEDLLSLAKVGHLEVSAEPVDTDEVLRKVLVVLDSQIASVGAVVQAGSLPRLHVPETLLVQILDNLIGNALRYGVKNGGTIEVGGERREDRVLFFVRDHGPGIPKDELERIFDVFFRGKTEMKSKGTGVGLATVQKIARLYRGRAWAEETPGGGSTFWVEMVDAPPRQNGAGPR